ncbi:metallophosphoesterase [Arcanobacterium haemolyticum]|nr:metallophosphoesterase [Arcanobacterium haemolyticum]
MRHSSAFFATAGIGLAGLSALGWGLVEAHAFVLRRRSIVVTQSPSGLLEPANDASEPHTDPASTRSPQSLRILHLSDIHLLARQSRKITWIQKLADSRPDFLILTGDQLSNPESFPALLEALDPFVGIPGAFVFGSHDYHSAKPGNPAKYLVQRFLGTAGKGAHAPQPTIMTTIRRALSGLFGGSSGDSSKKLATKDGARSSEFVVPNLGEPLGTTAFHDVSQARQIVADEKLATRDLPWRAMAAAFEERGWVNLNNARAHITVGPWNVSLVGVDDPHIHADAFPEPRSTEVAEWADLHIGLAHAPYTGVLDAMVRDDCDAVFAGHTHGGQICLPGGSSLVTNCDLEPKYASGLFAWPPKARAHAGARDAGNAATERAMPAAKKAAHPNADSTTPRDINRGRDKVMTGDGSVLARRSHAWVNVSAGLGTSPYAPIRIACRPEAIQIDVIPL